MLRQTRQRPPSTGGEAVLGRSRRIPLGGGTSQHAVRRARVATVRDAAVTWAVVAALAGVAAGAGGVLLWRSPAPTSVSLDRGGYRIGGQTLEARGGGVYRGPGADGPALVVDRRGDRVVAAASTNADGRHAVGRCAVASGGRSESCRFTVAGARIDATDHRTSSGWRRRYADGQSVDIRFDGRRPVPVPFPIGR